MVDALRLHSGRLLATEAFSNTRQIATLGKFLDLQNPLGAEAGFLRTADGPVMLSKDGTVT
jgi:hypothetical protein